MPAPHAFIQAGVVHRRSGLLPSMEVAGGNFKFLGVRFPTLPLVYLCFCQRYLSLIVDFFVDYSFRWALAHHLGA